MQLVETYKKKQKKKNTLTLLHIICRQVLRWKMQEVKSYITQLLFLLKG